MTEIQKTTDTIDAMIADVMRRLAAIENSRALAARQGCGREATWTEFAEIAIEAIGPDAAARLLRPRSATTLH